MDKITLYLLIYSIVSTLFNLFFGNKTFKFKDAAWALIVAMKDGKITEQEAQDVASKFHKDLFNSQDINLPG